ncbi:Gfo/Idh/MocA family oxidoreductase [Micromonospora sp. DR5-3]|uniref:Gfo/Idh/MocA family protein n=1 Tax=unclassified Micromonospora TaxID=2617518 RepID=UPI0011D60D08|nr:MULTISPECIES: Gfo/Idh/MocA family oxidoreductase [unclassified Micromonospora]MCW3818910.1 Gfo/Idh/MocA family oxidoreductase [Micromonospora sp. DR5-3]TYC20934.1 Gfo/Idh/MocA family oxidoreductase [Micromonospora sp. MP36]
MSAPLGVLLAGFAGLGPAQDHQAEMYLPAFADHPGFTIVAVTDADGTTDALRERSRSAAVRLGVPYDDELSKALARPEVDVVSVCVPLTDRMATTTAALATGRHVLVDKPMTLSAQECDAIAAVAADTGSVCLPAHHWRFHPAIRSAAAAVAAGRVGLPWNVQADFLVAGGPPSPLGELANFAVYPLDVIRVLTGLPVTQVFTYGEVDDVAVLSLSHERGMTSTVTVGRGPALDGGPGVALHRYRISGSHGLLAVDTARPAYTLRTATGRRNGWVGSDTVTALVDELHSAIRSGRQGTVAPTDARAAAAVVEAARLSAEFGRPVSLKEADG